MKAYYLFIFFLCCSCTSSKHLNAQETDNKPIAFPGAEGFGKYTTGGRGGKVFVVTNLNDAGEGSFREAAEAKGRRIIVFGVAGTIRLESKLVIKGEVTIAGQTAAGDGICLADQPVTLGGNNIILRYLRFRMGDRYQRAAGMVDGSGSDDALGASGRNNIIIDHCSISWSTDECFSVYRGDSTTLQWNIISEPLNYSYHFEKGDKDYEHHGFGGIWGGTHLSAHHNLFAHCNSRNPRFNGARLGASTELADYTNNVIYNWGGNNVYGGEAGHYNIVNNYYKYGPSTSNSVRYRIVNPTRQENPLIDFGKFFVTGNYVDGDPATTTDNSKGIHFGNNASGNDKAASIVKEAFDVIHLPLQSASDAYVQVLKEAGASLPKRDTLDQRIINDVKNRTGRIIDVQGGYPHGTAFDLTVNAWPALAAKEKLKDTDKDGMPDEWELKWKLDPNNSSDASVIKLHSFYTNIEVYINEISNRYNK